MTTRDLLVQQFGMIYDIAARNLEGMTHEHSLVQPRPTGNCANWILAHLVSVHNGVMQAAGAEPVWESDELARVRFDPIRGPDDAVDWNTLRDRFLGSRARCLAALSGLSDESLAEEVPDPFGGTTTRAGLLSVLAVHQTYHMGQLGLSRRIAGLGGAIRGPGQPA